MRIITIAIFSIIIFSCSKQEKPNHPTSLTDTFNITIDTSKSLNLDGRSLKKTNSTLAKKDSTFDWQKFVENFGGFHTSPRPILNDSGIYEIDLEHYKNRVLTLSNKFTERGKTVYANMFLPCDSTLNTGRFTVDSFPDAGIDMWAPKNCGFFNYEIIYDSQEKLGEHNYRNLTQINDSSYSLELIFISKFENKNYIWDKSWYIEVVKTEGNYLIDSLLPIYSQY